MLFQKITLLVVNFLALALSYFYLARNISALLAPALTLRDIFCVLVLCVYIPYILGVMCHTVCVCVDTYR